MTDIIGIGASVFDTLMLAEGVPPEDTKMQAMQTMTQGGGPCATALVAAARLGVSAAYLGNLGDDSYGRFMRADFEKYGVDTSLIATKPGCVSFHSFVLLNTQMVRWVLAGQEPGMDDHCGFAASAARRLLSDGQYAVVLVDESDGARRLIDAGVDIALSQDGLTAVRRNGAEEAGE